MTAGRHLALFAAVVALVVLGIAIVDVPLARWLKQYNETALRDVFGVITHVGVSTYYLIVSFVLFVVFMALARRRAPRLRKAAYQALFVFSAMAATVPVNLLKVAIGRARPRLLFREDLTGFYPFDLEYDYWSLPSGHAATIVALTMAFYFLWPRYRYLYLALAVLVCASRVIITAHYFADVVAGAYVAFLGVLLARALFVGRGLDVFAEPGAPPGAR
jgi:membrane-associated phospholipid phosphatase